MISVSGYTVMAIFEFVRLHKMISQSGEKLQSDIKNSKLFSFFLISTHEIMANVFVSCCDSLLVHASLCKRNANLLDYSTPTK